jgi:hypothetical protein
MNDMSALLHCMRSSLAFWLGLFGLVFLVWAWVDSMRAWTRIDFGPFIVSSRHSSLGLVQFGSTHREFPELKRESLKETREWFPGPRLMLTPGPGASVVITPRQGYLPYWLIIGAYVPPWLLLSLWRARRIRKIHATIPVPTPA